MENSLRKTDDRRKLKRQEVKERKKHEKEEKMQDIKKMQELKRKEIEEKLEKLKEITGNESLGFNVHIDFCLNEIQINIKCNFSFFIMQHVTRHVKKYKLGLPSGIPVD